MKNPNFIPTAKDLDRLLIKTSSVISKTLAGKDGITLKEFNNGMEKFYSVDVRSKNHYSGTEFDNYQDANKYFLQLIKRGA